MRPAGMRITLLRALILISLIAVAMAALRSASGLWSSLVFTMAVAAVGVAVLGALARREHERLPWVASAAMSAGYLLLAFGPWFSTEIRPYLVTSLILDSIFPQFHSVPPLPRGLPAPMLYIINNPNMYSVETYGRYLQTRGSGVQMNFERIGHSLFAILCGIGGAQLVEFWTGRRSGERQLRG